MAGKPSRTLLQLHALQERYAALEATNSELGKIVVEQAEVKTQNDLLESTIDDQHKRLAELRRERDAANVSAAQSEKRREAAENDNNFLRDQMMGMTRSIAATDGENRVLREFAPISEQQRYRDGMPRQQNQLRSIDGGNGAMQAEPWHHRRG